MTVIRKSTPNDGFGFNIITEPFIGIRWAGKPISAVSDICIRRPVFRKCLTLLIMQRQKKEYGNIAGKLAWRLTFCLQKPCRSLFLHTVTQVIHVKRFPVPIPEIDFHHIFTGFHFGDFCQKGCSEPCVFPSRKKGGWSAVKVNLPSVFHWKNQQRQLSFV